MNSHHKLGKLLELILYLNSRQGRTIDEITEKAEISRRTAFRYLNTIRDAGLVVNKENDRYRVDKEHGTGRDISELLHFNREEAYLLSQAIHSLCDETPIKANLFKKLYSIYDFHRVADTVVNKKQSENVHILIKAIEEQKQVVLRSYRSSSSKIIRDRLVEPYKFTYNDICVWCFDPEDRENKLFRVSRINRVEIYDKNWQYSSLHRNMEVDPFRISGPEKTPVKMMLGLRSYNLLIEEFPLAGEYVTKIDDRNYLFDGWVCGFEGVGRFVLGLINEIEILEPNTFKGYLMKVMGERKF